MIFKRRAPVVPVPPPSGSRLQDEITQLLDLLDAVRDALVIWDAQNKQRVLDDLDVVADAVKAVSVAVQKTIDDVHQIIVPPSA